VFKQDEVILNIIDQLLDFLNKQHSNTTAQQTEATE
jgi:hypothetical protein